MKTLKSFFVCYSNRILKNLVALLMCGGLMTGSAWAIVCVLLCSGVVRADAGNSKSAAAYYDSLSPYLLNTYQMYQWSQTGDYLVPLPYSAPFLQNPSKASVDTGPDPDVTYTASGNIPYTGMLTLFQALPQDPGSVNGGYHIGVPDPSIAGEIRIPWLAFVGTWPWPGGKAAIRSRLNGGFTQDEIYIHYCGTITPCSYAPSATSYNAAASGWLNEFDSYLTHVQADAPGKPFFYYDAIISDRFDSAPILEEPQLGTKPNIFPIADMNGCWPTSFLTSDDANLFTGKKKGRLSACNYVTGEVLQKVPDFTYLYQQALANFIRFLVEEYNPTYLSAIELNIDLGEVKQNWQGTNDLCNHDLPGSYVSPKTYSDTKSCRTQTALYDTFGKIVQAVAEAKVANPELKIQKVFPSFVYFDSSISGGCAYQSTGGFETSFGTNADDDCDLQYLYKKYGTHTGLFTYGVSMYPKADDNSLNEPSVYLHGYLSDFATTLDNLEGPIPKSIFFAETGWHTWSDYYDSSADRSLVRAKELEQALYIASLYVEANASSPVTVDGFYGLSRLAPVMNGGSEVLPNYVHFLAMGTRGDISQVYATHGESAEWVRARPADGVVRAFAAMDSGPAGYLPYVDTDLDTKPDIKITTAFVIEEIDNCPYHQNTDQADFDGDKVGNACDNAVNVPNYTQEDMDHDSVGDVIDAFPLDPNESVDTDGDGTGNNADTDDDNDGALDINDNCPLSYGLSSSQADVDGDLIGDVCDNNNDNDALTDVQESAYGTNSLNRLDPPLFTVDNTNLAGIDWLDYNVANSLPLGKLWHADNGAWFVSGTEVVSVKDITSANSSGGLCGLAADGAHCFLYNWDPAVGTSQGVKLSLGHLNGESDDLCVLTSIPSVQCVQLDGSLGPLPDTTVPSLVQPTDITSGAGFACAVDQGAIKCWNTISTNGVLTATGITATPGVTATPLLSGRVAMFITAGEVHLCAITRPAVDDGTRSVMCWGGDATHDQVNISAAGTINKPLTIDAGSYHTCVIDVINGGGDFTPNNTAVKCWGAGTLIRSNPAYAGHTVDDIYQSTVPTGLVNPVAVRAGGHRTCAIQAKPPINGESGKVENDMVCWPINISVDHVTPADSDGDGLSDYDEITASVGKTDITNPQSPDTDGDSVCDSDGAGCAPLILFSDNCPLVANPDQTADRDNDGIGNMCDPYVIEANLITTVASQDGFILSTNTPNTSSNELRVGDSNLNLTYRSFLDFSLPSDLKSITSATITVRRTGITGSPGSLGSDIPVDMSVGGFGSDVVLVSSDRNATATVTAAATLPLPTTNDFFSATLIPSAVTAVNNGLSANPQVVAVQFRMAMPVNHNSANNDYYSFASADHATTTYQPVLTVTGIRP